MYPTHVFQCKNHLFTEKYHSFKSNDMLCHGEPKPCDDQQAMKYCEIEIHLSTKVLDNFCDNSV